MKKNHHKKKPGFFKKWSAKLHLWFGLGIGFLIFIISITGALYVFKDEVENITRKDVIYHQEKNIEQKQVLPIRVMEKAVADGDEVKAHQMQYLSDVFGNIYQAGKTLGESLWALKVLMKQVNLCQPIVMPPLQSQSKDHEIELLATFKEILEKEKLVIS